jgi:hypothetical protein
LKNHTDHGFARAFAPFARDVQSREKGSYVKRIGPALITAKHDLEEKGGVIHPTLARACTQFIEYQEFLVNHARVRASAAQRNANLQEDMNRVEVHFDAQPRGDERLTGNPLDRQQARDAIEESGNGIGDLTRTPAAAAANTTSTPTASAGIAAAVSVPPSSSSSSRGNRVARFQDGIGEIHQGADSVSEVYKLIMNVRSNNNSSIDNRSNGAAKRQLEESRSEKEACIVSLEDQCKRLKSAIDASTATQMSERIERIEGRIFTLCDEVVAINMQICDY